MSSSLALPANALRPHRLNPVLLAGPVLAIVSLLPPDARLIATLTAIIGLGVPHGALDGELARAALRPRLGVAWFGVFALPYLGLSILVLLAWQVFPVATLAAFLAASVWHFGVEETGSTGPLPAIAAGGAPVAMAVLAHPAATAAIFATVSQTTMPWPPAWLQVASLLWLLPAAWRVGRLFRTEDPALPPTVLLAASAIVLPPLTSFAIYFVCVHAPAHTASLIHDRGHAARIVDRASSIRLALPVTVLTLLLGGALWPLYPGAPGNRLLCLTIQGLAALTLPHMLFELWLDRPARCGGAADVRGEGSAPDGKADRVAGALLHLLPIEMAADLPDEAMDQLRAGTVRAGRPHADAVVAHVQATLAMQQGPEIDADHAVPAAGEPVLQGVRHQLVHDQPERDRKLLRDLGAGKVQLEADVLPAFPQVAAQRLEVVGQLHASDAPAGGELVVRHADGRDPVQDVVEAAPRRVVRQPALLRDQHAQDELQVVLAAMARLLQQHLFLGQGHAAPAAAIPSTLMGTFNSERMP